MKDWTEDREREALARCEAATIGPWIAFKNGTPYEGTVMSWPDDDNVMHREVCRDPELDDRPEDREFISHARQDLPDAIAEIRRLRGLLNGDPVAIPEGRPATGDELPIFLDDEDDSTAEVLADLAAMGVDVEASRAKFTKTLDRLESEAVARIQR